ncbi:RraA family protein [Brachyspira pilosicoli]|uniref:RraA family protein n=1 Tax=Brachyspira pilosicoli TaxID=52584 RepID=UPI00300691B3
MEWNNDDELLKLVSKELYTAVVGDICDEFGYHKQFLSPDIKPIEIYKKVPIMVGRAMPAVEINLFDEPNAGSPFGKMFEALDNLKKNEIYICAGASKNYATIGELMCTAMIARGAVGAVTDGFIRDVEGIRELNFPVYSSGFYAQDQKGRGMVIDYRVPIEINGVRINPGDLIIGDIDGIIVVPREKEEYIITKSLEKSRSEKIIQIKIKEGMLASEAFEKFGIM